MISMYASSPKFVEFDFLLTMRARLINPQVHFDLAQIPPELLKKDVDDLELALEMFFITHPYVKE